ncbi:MAG: hypothetical protein ACTSUQ_00390 [Candidatus Freyarchaeota archaeon]
MNPIPSFFRRIREDPKYLGLVALTVILLIFYLVTRYAFSLQFLWVLTYNQYDGSYYLFFINYNTIFVREFAMKSLLFTVVLAASALVSIKISRSLTKTLPNPVDEEKSTLLIQKWKTIKKITSTTLILQYLTLIALIALVLLVWYNMLQQYTTTFLSLARYSLIIISSLGILYLLYPAPDDEKTLTQACLNIISSIREGYQKEHIKKIELAHSILYILLNHTLSKSMEELEEFNLEPPLTTLYLALLQNEKETVTKAKTIITSLLKAVAQQKPQDVLKHLAEIDKKLADVQELAKTMEITVNYPSLTLYPFNQSEKTTRLKAIFPLIAEILLAVILFLEKWLYYTTFKI